MERSAAYDVECAVKIGAEFFYRYGCSFEGGYVVVEGFPDAATFAAWYRNAEAADKDGRLVKDGERVRARLQLCADVGAAIAVLALDRLAGRVYIFDGFGRGEKALGYEAFTNNVYEWAYYYLGDRKKRRRRPGWPKCAPSFDMETVAVGAARREKLEVCERTCIYDAEGSCIAELVQLC